MIVAWVLLGVSSEVIVTWVLLGVSSEMLVTWVLLGVSSEMLVAWVLLGVSSEMLVAWVLLESPSQIVLSKSLDLSLESLDSLHKVTTDGVKPCHILHALCFLLKLFQDLRECL